MRLLAPVAPRVIPGRTIVIMESKPDVGVSRGIARVNLCDPVFFDHPLDHVPGMLLAVAMLELADHDSMLDSENVALRLSFTKFCELGEPVEVTSTRADATGRIDCVQSGQTIAKSSIAQRDTQPPAGYEPAPVLKDGHIAGELVHRVDDRNIAMSPLTVKDGHVWTRIREQAAIDGLPPRAAALASIVEAARQFGITILHRWGGHPVGAKMIFIGLTAKLPTAAPPDGAVQALSWKITPAEDIRSVRIDVQHVVSHQARKVGSLFMVGRCVDAEEYSRLRTG